MVENVCCIISRYNEDLKWTLEEPFCKFKYIVYNKGINEDFEKTHVANIITLDNVGRCDHTYLYHVIENYDRLSNIIVFLPGSLSINWKKYASASILNNIIHSKYENAYFKSAKHNNPVNESGEFTGFYLDNWGCSDVKNSELNNESKLAISEIRPLGKWYKHYFGDLSIYHITYGGYFSIDKRDIIKHPIEKYKNIISCISTHSNPEAGHYIERSWCAIFGPFEYTQVCR